MTASKIWTLLNYSHRFIIHTSCAVKKKKFRLFSDLLLPCLRSIGPILCQDNACPWKTAQQNTWNIRDLSLRDHYDKCAVREYNINSSSQVHLGWHNIPDSNFFCRTCPSTSLHPSRTSLAKKKKILLWENHTTRKLLANSLSKARQCITPCSYHPTRTCQDFKFLTLYAQITSPN